MNVLLTAGNSHAPLDRVRVITNGFSGPAGAQLARTAWARGHRVTVLTSQPYALADLPDLTADDPRGRVVPFRTFDDLAGLLQREVRAGGYDCLIHAAAVSDYISAGVYVPDRGTFFNARTRQWEGQAGPPALTDARSGTTGTAEPELWVRLARAPRLIDRLRHPWGFAGMLVCFHREVGLGDVELVEAAEQVRARTAADLVVAQTLEGAAYFAYLGPVQGRYDWVDQRELADRLFLTLEHMQRGRTQHG